MLLDSDHDAAAQALRTVLDEGDYEAAAQAGLMLGAILTENDDLSAARDVYQRVIDSGHPEHAQAAALALGHLLLNTGELPTAQVLLRFATEGAEPDEAGRADVLLAQVLQQLGDTGGAREARTRALACGDPAVVEAAQQLTLPPERSEGTEFLQIAYQRALAMLEQGRDHDAEPLLRKLLDSGHPHYGSLGAGKLYALHVDDTDVTRRLAEQIIELGHPEHLAWGHVLLGGVLVALDDPAGAARAYERAAQDPRPSVRLHALIQLSLQLRRMDRIPQARQALQRVIDSRHPRLSLEALGVLAEIQRDSGDTDAAIETFGLVVDSGHPEKAPRAAYHVGVLRYERGEPDAAVESFRVAARSEDTNVAHEAELALSTMDFDGPVEPGVEDTARLAVLPIEPSEPEPVDAAELERRAQQAAASGDIAAAREAYQGLVEHDPDNAPRARISLGLAEAALGDPARARQLLRGVAAEGGTEARGAAFIEALLDEPDSRGVLPVLLRVERDDESEVDSMLAGAEPSVRELAEAARVVRSGRSPADGLARLAESPNALAATAARTALAEELLGRGEHERARGLLQRVVDAGHPALRPWTACRLGELLMEHGEPDGTIAAFETALATRHPAILGEVFGKLSLIYRTLERTEALTDLYQRTAASGHPEFGPRAAFLLGEQHVDHDRLDQALELFTRAAGSSSTAAPVAVFAMRALRQELEPARSSFLLLADEDEPHFTATQLCLTLAHRYLRRGVPDFADWALRLISESGHAELRQQGLLLLGALREENGDADGALRAWRQAADGADAEEAAVAKVSAAELLRRRGSPERAAELLAEVAAAGVGSSERAAAILAELRATTPETPAQQPETPDQEPEATVRQDEDADERADRMLREGDVEAARAAIAEHRGSELLADFWCAARTDLAAAARLLAESDGEDARACSELALDFGRSAQASGGADAPAFFRLVADHGHPAALPKAHIALGKLAEKRGENAIALSWYRRAIRTGEPAAIARAGVLMAQLLIRVHDLNGAIAVARHAKAEGAGTAAVEAGVLLGHLQHRVGEAAAAKQAWDETEEAAESPEIFGMALQRRIRAVGETAPESAEMLLRAAESEDPGTAVPAHLLLAERADERGEKARWLERAIELGVPGHSDSARSRLGELLLEDGDAETAMRHFERVSACEDPEIAARGEFGIGLIRYEAADLPGAVHAFVKAAGHVPEAELGEDAMNNVRVVLDEQRAHGDHLEAADTLRRMTEVVPEEHVAEWAQETGSALLAADDAEAALVYLRCAVEIGAPDPTPEAVLALGEALHRRGDLAGARQAYERVLGADEHLAAQANYRLNELRADETPVGSREAR
ncbi:tetratricopeptide repeat protein [Saccharopolyspora sp. TS4A08]|uniref:Tetratricopeptide repeat protein n=1 Tax=Saccharopolyspora ipomoeae TaxID=3042027 RepID=A0ABT6PP64_9PSEU|nr:tetratricopeptide repeat protein [Saccharopolyspora sp. TS4A08]MDI2029758.1 tetratricopeptide repeat protein [Saccharopolyspora sp. TS4A08]